MRLVLAIVLSCMMSAAPTAIAQTANPTSTGDVNQQKLNAAKARELYVQGDSDNNKHNLPGAIVAWAKALELKPDSTYTQKCLSKARTELYKSYTTAAAKGTYDKDHIGWLVAIDKLLPLMPDRPELKARRADVEKGLSEDERLAYAAYTEGVSYAAKSDFANAKKSLDKAWDLAPRSSCIRQSLQNAERASNGEPVSSDGSAQLPKLYMYHATWCPACKQMMPVIQELEQTYKGKIDVVYIDVDKNKALARKNGVRSYPTMVFFDRNGREFSRMGSSFRNKLIGTLANIGVR